MPPPRGRPPVGSAPRTARKNRLSGFIDLEYRLLDDRGEAGSSWHQPGISGRVIVDNIGGTGLALRFRETARWSYRDQPPGGALDDREFIHRLSELALVYGGPESPSSSPSAGRSRAVSAGWATSTADTLVSHGDSVSTRCRRRHRA